MNIKQLRSIEQVLLMNNDICKLYEKRGITREELRTVFTLAAGRIKPWKDLNDVEEELPKVHESRCCLPYIRQG